MSKALNLAVILLAMFSQNLLANYDSAPKYYIVVNGDNQHPVSGASITPKPLASRFMADDFQGKTLYLLMKKGNDLSQYIPKEAKDTGQVFQLKDISLIKNRNGYLREWRCSTLTVLIAGDITRIDCDKTMRAK